jgi:hypothetical protein
MTIMENYLNSRTITERAAALRGHFVSKIAIAKIGGQNAVSLEGWIEKLRNVPDDDMVEANIFMDAVAPRLAVDLGCTYVSMNLVNKGAGKYRKVHLLVF